MRPRGATLAALLLAACGEAGPPAAPERACGLDADQFGAFVTVPAGQFLKGAAPVYPEEQPTLAVHVDAFQIGVHEVTSRQFAAFVEATGYVTDAERSAEAGGPGAGSAVFDHPGTGANARNPWALVPGATWRNPDGPPDASDDAPPDGPTDGAGRTIDRAGNDPVVHVSQADARAYAAWAGGRLPSEVEWEYAASLGLPDPADQASGAYSKDGQPVANTWQGVFPIADTRDDGFGGRAPVGCFAPSAIGLHDMIGNVWEWTDTPYAPGQHAIKGGSYLCADNFCRRYRPAARQPQDSDFSSSHIGFRIVRDVDAAG